MTITLDLAPDTEIRLLRKTERDGLNTEAAAAELLHIGLDEPATQEAGSNTLAELFAGRTGVFDSQGKFNYSSDTGKVFADLLTEKYRDFRI